MRFHVSFARSKSALLCALVLGALVLFAAGCATMSKPTIGVSGYDETKLPGNP